MGASISRPVHWRTGRPKRRSRRLRPGAAWRRRDPYVRRLSVEPLEDRRLLSVSIGDLVWKDVNSNGLQDAGEPGVAGAVVEVFSSTDATIGDGDDVSRGVAIADAEGHYAFAGVPDGLNYYLVFRPPIGYALTARGAGGDVTRDSDADTAGCTSLFTPSAGSERTDLDAGLVGDMPRFGWAFRAGESVQSVAVDPAGNQFVVGTFQGTVDFDPGPRVYNLTSSSGITSGFLAKYSPDGILFWARKTDPIAKDIALGADGSIYMTGSFQGTTDFDPGSGTFVLTSAGNRDVFVWKLNAAGNFVWAVRAGATSNDSGIALALGVDGSVYTTGFFQGTVDFDPGSGTFNLNGGPYGDVFVWRVSAAGNLVWACGMGESNDSESGNDIAIGLDGSVYTVGRFNHTVDFDPGPGTCNLTSAGYSDIFVSKLDSAGSFLWARRMGGADSDGGYGIAVAPDGNVYTAGHFRNTADFDPGPGTFSLSLPNFGLFVSKLDSAGNFLWARAVNGAADPYDITGAQKIAVAADGSTYTTGFFEGTQDFDPGPGTFTLASMGRRDAFVLKLDASGAFGWATGTGGTGDDYGLAVAMAPDGSAVATGQFAGSADFDPRATTFNLADGGGFVWRLQPNNQTPVDADLTPSSIQEQCPKYTVVGRLVGSDPDPNENFSYELLDSADGRFMLDGALVRVKNPALLDHDASASHDIRVRVRDSFGVPCEKTLTIAVTKVTQTRTLDGRVWSDTDGDGVQDAAEPGVAGAVAEVFQSFDTTVGNADDVSWGQTATDVTGSYSVSGLYEGLDYYLVFRTPAGYAFTLPHAGPDDVDSDADANGLTPLFSFSPGMDRSDLDAGLTGAAPGFGFAFSLGETSEESGRAITSDGAGNVYVTGYFRRTVDFDPGPGVYSFTSANSTYSSVTNYYADVFVAKYSTTGALYWARDAGSTSSAGDGAGGYGIAVGSDGSVYTTGQYGNSTDFDPGLDTYILPQNSNTESFVWKLDSAGNFVWARHLGGTSWDRGYAIAIAPDGGVCTTGYFTGTADFDPGPGTFNLTAATTDVQGGIYVSKLDAAGDFVWACTPGGTCDGQGYGIAVAPDGSLYTTGHYYGTADFDPGPGTFSLASSGADIYVWKLTAGGTFAWAGRIGGTEDDMGYGVAVGADGSVYTTGYFVGTADFDFGPATYNLTADPSDIFVLKLDPAGGLAWARRMGGATYDHGYAIAVGPDGGVCTTGVFRGTADFDPGTTLFNLTSAGARDVFVAKLSSSGGFAGAHRWGGTTDDYGCAIAVAPDGSVLTTGSFQSTVDFDPGLPAYNLTSAGYSDIFVSKLKSSNQAPTDLLLSGTSVAENQPNGAVVGMFSTTDVNVGDTFVYTLVSGEGSGNNGSFTIDASAHLLTAESFDYETLSSYRIRVRTTDQGGLWFERQFTITVTNVNDPPVLVPIGDRSIDELKTLAFAVTATDVDLPAQTLTYAAAGLPEGATFDPATRQFAWTPTESQGPGSFRMTFCVNDGSLSDEETITITVAEVNIAPELAAIGNKTAYTRVPLNFMVAGTDADLPANTLQFSATALPGEAMLDPTTGLFAWIPPLAGEYSVTFTVTDNGTPGLSDSETITITVITLPEILVSPTNGLVTTEDGGTASFTVVLATQPGSNVEVRLFSCDPSEGMVWPYRIVFTPRDWSTPQIATVTGVNDTVVDGAIDYAIVTAAAISSDPRYRGLDAEDVLVTNEDNEGTPGITVAPTAGLVTTEAGGTATFTIVLNSRPASNVEIRLSSSDTTEGVAAPYRLVFTPRNWDAEQRVTVYGRNDSLDDDDVAYTIVTAGAISSDPAYRNLNAADVWVTNLDDELPLLAAGKPGAVAGGPRLSATDIAPISAAAVARWEAAGLTRAERELLGGVRFVVRDLGGSTLGVASPGRTIFLDDDAVGFGWFVDRTPRLDEEFAALQTPTARAANADSAAFGRMDLLTVVLHEMGHLLGREHADGSLAAEKLMADRLATGVRRVPDGGEQALRDAAFASLDDRASDWEDTVGRSGSTDPWSPANFRRSLALPACVFHHSLFG